MEWCFLTYALLFLPFHRCAPPHRPEAEELKREQLEEQKINPFNHLDYHRYLEAVVKQIQADSTFDERLRKMNEQEIREGKIADYLHELSPIVLERLRMVKAAEIKRIQANIQANQVKNGGDTKDTTVPKHIDLSTSAFEPEDLRRLIKATFSDMEELDKKRREDFKEYKMQKEAELEHKMKKLTPEERAKVEEEYRKMERAQQDHEKLKHPGSRDQFEEVWEEKDELPKDAYDAKTFFNLHDKNGDGRWSKQEIELLFDIELSKLYNESDPNFDARTMNEERHRMREHVFNQMDKNKDSFITLEEFLSDEEAQRSKVEAGWEDLGDNRVYTKEELEAFKEAYAKEKGHR
ncbi:hypothetical protein AB6A40_005043 [Gnathostoma spinigerum]|uniref:Nucleobindin-1 n=1 Tax=Gnathostoma spinigerum TaxID=75299 RepID=A0ABD6ELZ3_9BILA